MIALIPHTPKGGEHHTGVTKLVYLQNITKVSCWLIVIEHERLHG